MNRRKIAAAFATGVASLTLATGCTGGAGSDATPAEPAASVAPSETGTIKSIIPRRLGTCSFELQPATGTAHKSKNYRDLCKWVRPDQSYQLYPDHRLGVEMPYLRVVTRIDRSPFSKDRGKCLIRSEIRGWPETEQTKKDAPGSYYYEPSQTTCDSLHKGSQLPLATTGETNAVRMYWENLPHLTSN